MQTLNKTESRVLDVLTQELPHLTPRQLDALAWVCRYWAARRHGPTQREIATGLGASARTATAAPFVDPLVAKGYLERTAAASRNVKPTPRAAEKLRLEGIHLEGSPVP